VTTTIRWMLFDADGVLQIIPDGWQAALDGLLGEDPAGTLLEVFTDEQEKSMTGGDFREILAATLRRRGVDTDPDRILQCWRLLKVDMAMIDRIRQLRQVGVRCALATNQQNVRVQHMRQMPEYHGVFDAEFYSWEVGLAKPDPAYFAEIVQRIGVRPNEALFVDDRDDNVQGAREVGLRAEVFVAEGGVPELDRILALHGVTRLDGGYQTGS
jgi:FMN phosphatase YigB (HAD superfamily)